MTWELLILRAVYLGVVVFYWPRVVNDKLASTFLPEILNLYKNVCIVAG